MTDWTPYVISAAIGLIGYLLSRKDVQQQSQIDDLYLKNAKTREELTAFKLSVAREIHSKPEVEKLLSDFKIYLDERFQHLEKLMDRRGQP